VPGLVGGIVLDEWGDPMIKRRMVRVVIGAQPKTVSWLARDHLPAARALASAGVQILPPTAVAEPPKQPVGSTPRRLP
jgi:hypothetical protein